MNIIVTGTDSGIGLSTILKFLESPENQAIAITRSGGNLLKEANARNIISNLHVYPHPISEPFPDSFHEFLEKFISIDILINNAATLTFKPFREMDDKEWMALFEVNFFGAQRLIRYLLPFMSKSRHAHIVNIGSMAGFQGSTKFSGMTAYSASKAALANLTETLAVELEKEKIKVNCLALGAVQTPMLTAWNPAYKVPLTAEDVASYIVWFAKNGSKFFNGKVIPVAISNP